MIYSNNWLVKDFLDRGMVKEAAYYTAVLIYGTYYMLNKPIWLDPMNARYYTMNKPEWINQENGEYRQATELRFASYYNKHHDLWDSLPPVNRMQISNAVRNRSVNEGMMMEAVTIDGWLRHIATLASDAQGLGEGNADGQM